MVGSYPASTALVLWEVPPVDTLTDEGPGLIDNGVASARKEAVDVIL